MLLVVETMSDDLDHRRQCLKESRAGENWKLNLSAYLF